MPGGPARFVQHVRLSDYHADRRDAHQVIGKDAIERRYVESDCRLPILFFQVQNLLLVAAHRFNSFRFTRASRFPSVRAEATITKMVMVRTNLIDLLL